MAVLGYYEKNLKNSVLHTCKLTQNCVDSRTAVCFAMCEENVQRKAAIIQNTKIIQKIQERKKETTTTKVLFWVIA